MPDAGRGYRYLASTRRTNQEQYKHEISFFIPIGTGVQIDKRMHAKTFTHTPTHTRTRSHTCHAYTCRYIMHATDKA